MKKLKRYISILIICLSFYVGHMTAYAATEYVDGYLRYTVEDGSVTITGYNGRESEVTIPAKIAGVPVNTIASGAFLDSTKVTKINLPDTIMTIEEGAFRSGQTVVYNYNTSNTEKTDPEHSTENKEEDGQKPPQETTIGSVEEIDVDFSDDSKEETSKDKNDDKEITKEDFENVKEDITTIIPSMSEEQTGIEPTFVVSVIVVLSIVVIGIYVYRKKGSK